jgi:putative mRNA 3-end processing factor
LLQLTDAGLYCPAGDFHVDPWLPVERALLTHGHADHARRGCRRYLAAAPAARVLRTRLGQQAAIDTLPYGRAVEHGCVRISLHPAGHILGSAQVRLEHGGRVWVVSGDYKLAPDPTCAPFEPVRCHAFVTESTFGLPIYRWPAPAEVFGDVNAWWRQNRLEGRATLLFGYALGKAQRLLAGLDPDIGPVFTHGAVERLVQDYRDSGVDLPPTVPVREAPPGTPWHEGLVLAPPSAHGTPWTRRFGAASTGLASGWMRIRGARRRRAVDRGFVLSDHADWPGLLQAVAATGAEQVWVTHGYVAVLVRYLRERGLDAHGLETRFEGEHDDAPDEVPTEGPEGEGE